METASKRNFGYTALVFTALGIIVPVFLVLLTARIGVSADGWGVVIFVLPSAFNLAALIYAIFSLVKKENPLWPAVVSMAFILSGINTLLNALLVGLIMRR